MNWGDRIDGCKTVVRMWDWYGWQQPIDYGRRYDYGLVEIHPGLIDKFHRYNHAMPSVGFIGSVLFAPERCQMPYNCELFYQAPWVEIGKSLGGVGATGRLQYTRGTLAALWSLFHMRKSSVLVLVGFDNVYAGETLPISDAFNPEYVRRPSTFPVSAYRGGMTKQGNHDFGIESKVLKRVAKLRGIKVHFAQDCW